MSFIRLNLVLKTDRPTDLGIEATFRCLKIFPFGMPPIMLELSNDY